jgi:hypothetical protein
MLGTMIKQAARALSLAGILAGAAVFSQACGNLTVNGGGGTSCVASFTGPEVSGAEVSFTDGTTQVAESFKLANDAAPGSVQLKLKLIGTAPTGSLIVKIEGDSSGPNNVPIETATLSASSVKASTTAVPDAYYTFTFSTPATLKANIVYWIRVQGDNTFQSNQGIQWMGDNTTPGDYKGGTALSYNGSAWTSGVLGTARAFLYQLGCS